MRFLALVVALAAFPLQALADGGNKPLPKKVVVEIVNAMAGPGKVDGHKWDGMGKVDPKMASALVTALAGASPYSLVASLIVSPINSGTSAPDVKGKVEVILGGEIQKNLTFILPKTQDSYTPNFPSHEFKDIPLEDSTQFKVTLVDSDLAQDDPMGVVILSMKDLVEALKEEKVYQVKVADQTQNQILFVGISVRAQTSAK